MRIFILLLIAFQLKAQKPTDRPVGSPCEDCELMYEGMPTKLNWATSIAPLGEPGEKLIISGTIYQHDGKTPATGIILYIYQTDATGLYTRATNQRTGLRHGHLRGWMQTDAQGRYQFTTIRPAAYPKETIPQHIHPIIKEPDLTLYWIDDFVFDDDPLLTGKERSRHENRGGNGILHLRKDSSGTWIGKRDIVLGLHVSGYPKR